MPLLFRSIVSLAVLCLVANSLAAQKIDRKVEIDKPMNYRVPQLTNSPQLGSLLSAAVSDTLAANPGFKNEEIAATLIDLRNPDSFEWTDLNGDKRIYPASVVKMFYMAALERQLQDGKIASSPELERGLSDMIVVSSNEATQYILDVLTGTSSGAELPPAEFEKWQAKRNRVNRYFASMGYTGINVNQKTFCEDAYGIEQQSRNYKGQNRNMLTTNATARLLGEIAMKRFVTSERSEAML